MRGSQGSTCIRYSVTSSHLEVVEDLKSSVCCDLWPRNNSYGCTTVQRTESLQRSMPPEPNVSMKRPCSYRPELTASSLAVYLIILHVTPVLSFSTACTANKFMSPEVIVADAHGASQVEPYFRSRPYFRPRPYLPPRDASTSWVLEGM